jgi:predicted DNA-binding transcriptional regulator AlpA
MAHKSSDIAKSNADVGLLLPEGGAPFLVPGPKLRRMIGISAVTLWRWRHDKRAGFPTAKSINGRLYFPWHEVQAWIEKQRGAA